MEICSQRWVLARLYETDIAILDCRSEAHYTKSRIPGAISAHSMNLEQLEIELGQRGINEDTRLVLYTEEEMDPASELIVSLHKLGHLSLFFLANGFRGWQNAGFPIETKVPSIRIPTFYKKI